MNSKTTKILIAAVVILAGIYVVQRFTSQDSTTGNFRPFSGIDTSGLNRVEVNFGQKIVIEREAGGWTITSPVKSEADPGQMSLLLTRIASNPTAIVVADNPGDSSAYGLGAGAPSASFAASNGKNVSMQIGNLTPDFSGCYIQLAGKKEILQLSTNLRTLVGQSLANWRDKQIFSFQLSNISTVDFAVGDSLYHFFHMDTTWNVNGVRVPEMTAEGVVEALIGTSAIGFIDSSVTPQKVVVDYGITLSNREHITGQIFKSAESETGFGQLCLSNSADNQTYTVSATLPETILRGLRELQTVYLSRDRS